MKSIIFSLSILLLLTSCYSINTAKSQPSFTSLVNKIIDSKNNIPDSLSLALLKMVDTNAIVYPSEEWVRNKIDSLQNYQKFVNLDDDDDLELIIQIYDIHSTIFFFKKDIINNWVLCGTLNCPIIQPFGMAPPAAQFTIYPEEKLVRLDHVPNHGSNIWHDETAVYTISNYNLKKVFAIQYGAFWPSNGECCTEMISTINLEKINEKAIKLNWRYELGTSSCLETDSFDFIQLHADSAKLFFERANHDEEFKLIKIDGFSIIKNDVNALYALKHFDIFYFTNIHYDTIMKLELIGNEKQKRLVPLLKKSEIWEVYKNWGK